MRELVKGQELVRATADMRKKIEAVEDLYKLDLSVNKHFFRECLEVMVAFDDLIWEEKIEMDWTTKQKVKLSCRYFRVQCNSEGKYVNFVGFTEAYTILVDCIFMNSWLKKKEFPWETWQDRYELLFGDYRKEAELTTSTELKFFVRKVMNIERLCVEMHDAINIIAGPVNYANRSELVKECGFDVE